MEIEKPGVMRSRIVDTESRIEVVMPSRRRKLLGIYGLAFLLLMYIIVFTIIQPFGDSKTGSIPGPFIIFALFWGWATLIGGISSLWYLIGQEILLIDSSMLRITRRIGFIAWKKKCRLESCSNYRINPVGHSKFSNKDMYAFFGFGGGVLAFDYKYKTVEIASGLNEAEAAYIIKLLQDRGFIKKQ